MFPYSLAIHSLVKTTDINFRVMDSVASFLISSEFKGVAEIFLNKQNSFKNNKNTIR